MKPVISMVLALAAIGCGPKHAPRAPAPGPPISGTDPAEAQPPAAGAIVRRVANDSGAQVTLASCVPIQRLPGVYVTTCDWVPHWWGAVFVSCVEEGAVTWHTRLPTKLENAYVLTARPVDIRGHSQPLIEVFDSSHMGNGSLVLLELHNRSLRPLLETRARTNLGRYSIQEPHLEVRYQDLDFDGVDDVILTGTSVDDGGEEYALEDKDLEVPLKVEPRRVVPCRKVLLWNANLRQYVEDLRYREGIDAALD